MREGTIIDYLSFYPQPAAGVDEAGRGCLAGPVFAGAVILKFPQEFKDSKLLSHKERQICAQEIKKNHIFAIGTASAQEIEELNIHQASLLAMKRAVDKLKLSKGHLLIDGKFPIKQLPYLSQTPIVKGDQKASPISAASILAKTERDQRMFEYAKIYPEYGFEKHKGYPVKSHKLAIKKYGHCPIHRKIFSGVKEHINPPRGRLF